MENNHQYQFSQSISYVLPSLESLSAKFTAVRPVPRVYSEVSRQMPGRTRIYTYAAVGVAGDGPSAETSSRTDCRSIGFEPPCCDTIVVEQRVAATRVQWFLGVHFWGLPGFLPQGI